MLQRVLIAIAVVVRARAADRRRGHDRARRRRSRPRSSTLLRRLRETHRLSLLLVTHDLAVVAEICERILVMYGGEIVESGPTAEVLGNPQHPYTQALMRVATIGNWERRDARRHPGPAARRRRGDAGLPVRAAVRLRHATGASPGRSRSPTLGEGRAARCVLLEDADSRPLRAGGLRMTLTDDHVTAAPARGRRAGAAAHGSAGCRCRTRRRRRATSLGTGAALTDATLQVRPGEIVGIVGETGSGKTTLARATVGLVRPAAGTHRVRRPGRRPAARPGAARLPPLGPGPAGLPGPAALARPRPHGRASWSASRSTSPARCRAASVPSGSPSRLRAGRPRARVDPRPASAASSRAASASGSRWPGPSRPGRGCCSATSRSPRWTSPTATSCSACSTGCAPSSTSRS